VSAPTSVERFSNIHPFTGSASSNPSTISPTTLLQNVGHAVDSWLLSLPLDSHQRNSVRLQPLMRQQTATDPVYPRQFSHSHQPQDDIMSLLNAAPTSDAMSRATRDLYEHHLENQILQSRLQDALLQRAESTVRIHHLLQQSRNDYGYEYPSQFHHTSHLAHSSMLESDRAAEAAVALFALTHMDHP
jgi:hypothetical protein